MSATYLQRYELVEDPEFHKRIQTAIWIAATDILNDNAVSAEKKRWARNALASYIDMDTRRRISIILAANTTIGAAGNAALDSDIQFVVNDQINKIIKGWGE